MTTIESEEKIVILIIIATFTSGIVVRLLSFLIKSRCKNIECCCIKCERDVIKSYTGRTSTISEREDA